MKKTLMVLAALALFASLTAAQDRDTIVTKMVWKDTLYTNHDTVQVSFYNEQLGLATYSVVAYMVSGVDTVTVYKLAADELTWSQVGLTLQESNTDTTKILVGTIPREYVIFPLSPPLKLRFVTTPCAKSCVLIVSGKRWRTWLGGG